MSWPNRLQINAWSGKQRAEAAISPQALRWTLRAPQPTGRGFLAVPPAVELTRWDHPQVGWGLILPERSNLSAAQLATADDAPEPIRELVRRRDNAPVFRYQSTIPSRFTHLRNYRNDQHVALSGSEPGVGRDQLPYYLLIYATPDEIPWSFQYILNASRPVGRLDLEGAALERYVTALLNSWSSASARIEHAVAWAVDTKEGPDDITSLMRDAITVKVVEKWQSDATLKPNIRFIDGLSGGATAKALHAALVEGKPALIVTSSHGKTSPLSNRAKMLASLGLPVDEGGKVVEPGTLLSARQAGEAPWRPGGAIWYAHACCSAGSDKESAFIGLVEQGSQVDRILKGVAALGAHTARLPQSLLGAEDPLRAFIGHVEPTFNWTLLQPQNQQFLTHRIVTVLYDNIYRGWPVGMAFRSFYMPAIGELETQAQVASAALNRGERTEETILYCQLAARDIQSMVILGDPTAALPKLP